MVECFKNTNLCQISNSIDLAVWRKIPILAVMHLNNMVDVVILRNLLGHAHVAGDVQKTKSSKSSKSNKAFRIGYLHVSGFGCW